MISCHSRELKTIYCIIGNNNFIHTYHVTKILHYKTIDIVRLSQPWEIRILSHPVVICFHLWFNKTSSYNLKCALSQVWDILS